MDAESEVRTKEKKDQNSDKKKLRYFNVDMVALTINIAIFIATLIVGMFSFVPSLGAPTLPSFNNPTKGFDPRGTFLSNSIHTLHLVDKYISNNDLLQYDKKYVINSSLSRERRSTEFHNDCQDTFRGRLVFAPKNSGTLMTAENLKSMCHLEKKIMKSAPSRYNGFYLGGCPDCCQSHSLGEIVAQFANKTNCKSIDDSDVKKTMDIFEMCSVPYSEGILNKYCDCKNVTSQYMSHNCPFVPCICSWKKIVYNTLRYFTDSDFLKTPTKKILRYAAAVSSTKFHSFELYKYIYSKHLKDSLPEYKGVKVVGFHFANFRFELFNTVVIKDVIFPVIAMVLVSLLMWFFLESLFLSLCVVSSIIMGFILSYFLYHIAFGIKFFPFFNLLTVILIVCIGADDAFLYYEIFRETKHTHPNGTLFSLTLKSMRHAALSMFVTSFTTSAAFFACVTSHITAIKTFGIFAGISILTIFVLMLTWFPINVMLHERWIQISRSKKSNKKLHRCKRSSKIRHFIYFVFWIIDFPCHLLPTSKNILSKISKNFFESILPKMIFKKKLYLLWMFVFIGLTIGFAYISFISPGIRLTKIQDFQMFTSSSTMEQYNLHIKKHFRYSNDQKSRPKMKIDLIWGVKTVDNGNYLDPEDKGTLDYDLSFNPELTADSQKWFSSFCKSLWKQKFYSGDSGALCSIQTIRLRCSESDKPLCCKNETFPFSINVIDDCMARLALPRPGLYHELKNKQSRLMRISFDSNVHWSSDFKIMDEFWDGILKWSNSHFSKAPPPFKNGWIASKRLHFMYSIQKCLLKDTATSMIIAIGMAFGVMLLTTLNLLISLYAIITIIGIIVMTIGSLVLLGWELVVLESIVLAVAVGLSIDFTLHYGVAYRLSSNKKNRKARVLYSFIHVGPAVFMASFTTFITGLLMMPSEVLVYIQLGQFIMLVMFFSWLFSNFVFMSLNTFIGPLGNFAQLDVSHISRLCKSKERWHLSPMAVHPANDKRPYFLKTAGKRNECFTLDVEAKSVRVSVATSRAMNIVGPSEIQQDTVQ